MTVPRVRPYGSTAARRPVGTAFRDFLLFFFIGVVFWFFSFFGGPSAAKKKQRERPGASV